MSHCCKKVYSSLFYKRYIKDGGWWKYVNIICRNKIQKTQTKTVLLKYENISLQYKFAILRMVGYMR